MSHSPKDNFDAATEAAAQRKHEIARDTYQALAALLGAGAHDIAAILSAQPADYQRWRLPHIERQIRSRLVRLAGVLAETGAAGQDAAWAAGQALIDEPLAAGGLAVEGLAQQLSDQQLVAMREFMTDRLRDVSLSNINKINGELAQVIIGVQAPGQAVGNVTRLLNERSRRRALTIVRTELGRAFAAAAQARMTQAQAIVPTLQKQWRRSGKLHSRPLHDAADGQVQDIDAPFVIGGDALRYPRDPRAPAYQTINCGCDSLPYIPDWDMLHPGERPRSPNEQLRRLRAA